MADKNIFMQLKIVLQNLKDFLDANVPTIKPAIQALASIIPQIVDMLDLLIDLLSDLKNELQNLDVSNIPGLEQLSMFTKHVVTLLNCTNDLLPNQAEKIEEIRSVASVVTSLPSLAEIKPEIIVLIDAITAHLRSLKP